MRLPNFRLWPWRLWFQKEPAADETSDAMCRQRLEEAKKSVPTKELDDAYERMETLLTEVRNGTE